VTGFLTKPRLAIALGAALVLAVVIFAVTRGLGEASVPSDAVAVVDTDLTVEAAGIEDGEISQEAFDKAFEQASARQGQPQPPAPDNAQYGAIRDQALGDLLDIVWIMGEAEERGIEASDREVEDEFQQTKNQSFRTEKEYQQFLRQSGFTQEDVNLRIELQLLSEKIQAQVQEDAGEASREEAEEYYEANEATFEQPEQRDVRVIVNKDAAKVSQAQTRLQADDSDATWNQVASQFSNDPTSKNQGGLRQSVTQGVLPPEVDSEVFAAEEGELVGPIETPGGQQYLFQVQGVTEGGTQAFEDVAEQVQQQLSGQQQQEFFTDFLADYREKWIKLTVCNEDFLIDRCENFVVPPTPCEGPQEEQLGCPAPVPSTNPGAPGSFLPFSPPSGQPQRPNPGGDQAAAPEVPGGLPGQVPGAPPGAAPPGAAPGAPPGG
jgi:parvulin-like peptidyl-prolyl isomerase